LAPPAFIELSFELRDLDVEIAENACFECGATSVTFSDMRDDPGYRCAHPGYEATHSTSAAAPRPQAC